MSQSSRTAESAALGSPEEGHVAPDVSSTVWMRPRGLSWAARKIAATKSGCASGSPPLTVMPPVR